MVAPGSCTADNISERSPGRKLSEPAGLFCPFSFRPAWVRPLQDVLRQQLNRRSASPFAQSATRRDRQMWRRIEVNQQPVEVLRRNDPALRRIARKREGL